MRDSAYCEPIVHPVADLTIDGYVNSADWNAWTNIETGAPSASAYGEDLDFDGLYSYGEADADLFWESYNANAGLGGRGRLSTPSVANRHGYAGYEWDDVLTAYHVRYRVYLPEIGRWTRRDPAGYVDGMGLYQYVGSMPVLLFDPWGLNPRDKWWGLPKEFWDWYHGEKSDGMPDLDKQGALDAHNDWVKQGKPRRDKKGLHRGGGRGKGRGGPSGSPIFILISMYMLLDATPDALAQPKCALYFKGIQDCIGDPSQCNYGQTKRDGIECSDAILTALGKEAWAAFEEYQRAVLQAMEQRIKDHICAKQPK